MNKVKAIFITLGSAISGFLGVLFIPVLIMVACNTIDFITGIIAARFRDEGITSKAFYRGICKKVCMWLLVVVGALIDETIKCSVAQIGITMPFTFLVACVVCVWIICNELLSILENMAEIGIPMPEFLKKLVRYLQKQTENKIILPEEETNKNNE